MQFSKDFPDELRSQILTSDVVGKKVALKQKGKEFSGLCPFHNEKTPSFTVNDQKGFYHCFGCGAHGDIITFVKETEGLDFKEAVFKIADDHNIPVPIIKRENLKEEDIRQQKLKRQFALIEEICRFFELNLRDFKGQNALNYLQKRGLDQPNIQKFRLGYALDGYNFLHSHLTKLGYQEQELLESGAVGKNQNGKLYDKFRNRVIFPISNRQGKIIAFGGRILGDGQPKYLNSSETPLFKKGFNLYNYSNARKSIYDQKFAIVVEGYMDVLALAINGIENAVAPLGTAVTINQIEELFKVTNEVVLFLDGDRAGLNAMNRVIELALPIINSHKILKFAILPTGLDPDDFVKTNGKTACLELLQNAQTLSQTLFDFEAEKIGIKNQNQIIAPEKKAQLEANLMHKIEQINDVNSKKYFSQYYKNQLFSLGRKTGKNNIKTSKIVPQLTKKFDQNEIFAQNIIVLLVREPKLIDYQDEYCNIRELDFEDETLSNIKESLIEYFDEKNDCNSQELLDYLSKFSLDQTIKDNVLRFSQQSSNGEIKLRILALKYHHGQVSKQYQEILNQVDDIQTCNSSITSLRQKEIFDHKTKLEKKILELESNLT